MLIDQRVGSRIRIDRVRTHVMRPGDIMPKMAIHRVDEKQFTVLVPVMSPRIGCAAGEHLDDFAFRVVTPHRTTQRNPLLRWRARNANFSRTRRPATTIKPAVRPEP